MFHNFVTRVTTLLHLSQLFHTCHNFVTHATTLSYVSQLHYTRHNLIIRVTTLSLTLQVTILCHTCLPCQDLISPSIHNSTIATVGHCLNLTERYSLNRVEKISRPGLYYRRVHCTPCITHEILSV